MAGFLTFTREKPINRIVEVDVSEIVPNPHQPRTGFDPADIQSLAESIAQNGILQPLTVRRGEGCYELVAGERRLRAAKLAGMQAVPCIILEISSRNSAVMALVENIQRQDLSFFDEASAIEKLITYYGMTQEDAAAKLGKAQSTIANKLRLRWRQSPVRPPSDRRPDHVVPHRNFRHPAAGDVQHPVALAQGRCRSGGGGHGRCGLCHCRCRRRGIRHGSKSQTPRRNDGDEKQNAGKYAQNHQIFFHCRHALSVGGQSRFRIRRSE